MSPAHAAILEADVAQAFDERIAQDNRATAGAGDSGAEAVSSLEQHAEFHRMAAAEYEQRRAQARKDAKSAAAAFRAERNALRDRYNADLAAIADREAQHRCETTERMETAACLAEASRAALKTIERHL